ncbi:MAG: hypothetical protein V3V35_11600 [Dehalococcoidia bacterium]
MDGSYRMDLDEIILNIQSAEVVCLHFPLLRKTLILDVRSDVEDPPIAKVMPMAKSVEDRFRSLRRLRPRFPQPEKVTIIPWPKYVDSLVRLGVWDKVLQRFSESGHPDSVRSCEAALNELRSLERRELTAAITGKQYHTIWQSSEE